MSDRLHVVVIGGGLGGLCLAQGLRQAGVGVSVYERDAAPDSRWEGYCIQVNPAGSRSLHACLPEPLWRAFLGTAGPGGEFGFLTEQLRELVVVEESVMYPVAATDPAEGHYTVDRRALRRLLLHGLDDVVRFGAEFASFEPTEDSRIAANFADGRRAVGDVLIGADGPSSRLRRQYLPQARRTPLGVGGVGHKLALTPSSRSWLPPRLLGGMNSVNVAARRPPALPDAHRRRQRPSAPARCHRLLRGGGARLRLRRRPLLTADATAVPDHRNAPHPRHPQLVPALPCPTTGAPPHLRPRLGPALLPPPLGTGGVKRGYVRRPHSWRLATTSPGSSRPCAAHGSANETGVRALT